LKKKTVHHSSAAFSVNIVLAFVKAAGLYQFVDRVQKEDPHGEEQQ
jgi:hypothetical protein